MPTRVGGGGGGDRWSSSILRKKSGYEYVHVRNKLPFLHVLRIQKPLRKIDLRNTGWLGLLSERVPRY